MKTRWCTECGAENPPSDGRPRLICSEKCHYKRKARIERDIRAGKYIRKTPRNLRRDPIVGRFGVAAIVTDQGITYRVSTRYRETEHATWPEAREVYELRTQTEIADRGMAA